MSEPDKALESMIANLEANTGHDLDWWIDRVNNSGKDKHGEIVAFLKEQGLGHGYANLVTHLARDRAAGGSTPEELVDAQYRGKESIRPILDRLMAEVLSFGTDVHAAPRKSVVSLRRNKKFADIEPATKTRVDLWLNLKGFPGTDRLREAGGMCTHKVAITSIDEVDAELLSWLREAYDMA